MLRLILTFVLIAIPAAHSNAGFVYSFGQSNYNVAANGTVDVEIYLLQSNPVGDPVDLSVDGLQSGGVNVFFDNMPPSQPAFVNSLADIVPNPQFDDTLFGEELFLTSGSSAGFVDGVNTTPLTGNSIFLGTISFTAGGVVGEVTHLLATDLRAQDDIIAGDAFFTPLDSLVGNGSATITVTAVPEPSSALLLVLGATLFTRFRHRRNQC